MVVIPDFMTGALVSALRTAVGSGARGSPESVQIRGVQAAGEDRVTVVYRVSRAHAADWGLPGGQILTDEQGRPIALTEGFVVCRPATAVRRDGISQQDLDLAHSRVVPAYLEFWAQGDDYSRQASKSFTLAPSGKPVTVHPLESAIPKISPRPELIPPPEAIVPVPLVLGERRARRAMLTATAVGVVIAIITIAVLLAVGVA